MVHQTVISLTIHVVIVMVVTARTCARFFLSLIALILLTNRAILLDLNV
jgi:hypothetical protein